ncbi:TIM-barrel domain-containing protein [Nakamurella sp. A5-74]|uniref:TIM-barrel domain-containing protein n=1 Tax=Nakamurella sp. A5-74 TaxID=3158264 RepID=A0AAU8DT71_9ACTN
MQFSRRTLVLGVLGAVPLSLLGQGVAQAGTLTGVFHGPTGNDELYATTPTERAPRDPMVSQTVQMHATTWPISTGQTVWITWTKNGIAQTPVGAGFDYNSGGNSYWTVSLGSFAKGDAISYSVNADVDGGGTKTTGPYSFKVTDWSQAAVVSSYVDNGSSVDVAVTDSAGALSPKIRFTFTSAGTFRTQIAPAGTGLSISGSTPYSVTNSASTLQLTTSAIQVRIQKSPYRVSVFQADGTTLIARQYDPSVFRNTGWATDAGTTIRKIEDHWQIPVGQRLEGLGERYDSLDQRGKDVDHYSYNQYQDQGTTHRTYLSVPFMTNSAGYAIYVPSNRYSVFNLGTHLSDMAGFTVDASGAANATVDYYFITGTRSQILDTYTSLTARPKLPPKWAFGLWMSANEWNTQSEVQAQLANVTSYDIPHSVLVLEQWSDEATFYLWHGATYTPKAGSAALTYADLTFPAGGEWSDPKAMVTAAHNQNVKVVLWQIPVLKTNFDTNPATAPQQHLNDRSYAAAQGYLIGDGAGGQYKIPSGQWFGDSLMPDFTSTAATAWWMSKRQYLFSDVGIDGMKTDGSEAVMGRGLTFADGRKGDEMHNAYPNEYTRVYAAAVASGTSSQGVLFSRAGTAGCQANSIFWAGDQASTFAAFQDAIRAGLSAGASGVPFWTWDMAGFTGSFPSSELYLRSASASTFMPIMQYHSEKSNPSPSEARTPWNVQSRSGDTTVVPTFRKFANVRMNLIPYLYTEAKKAADSGLPMMQAMSIAFPADTTAAALETQWMCGRQLLVSPIVAAGATTKAVQLPTGEWYDFFFGGKASGPGVKSYYAGTDRIPVYASAGAIIPLNLNANYELGGSIGNSVTSYTNLVFRIYPSGTSSYAYFDDAPALSRTITVTENWAGHQVTVSLPALTTTSTLQVTTTQPSGVTRGGTALTARSSLAALISNAEGWYWDSVGQFTFVKVASAAATRSIVLSGVDKSAYEAEFSIQTGVSTNTNHPGYTGTGFVDGFDAVGDQLDFDVNVAATGSHVLKFRYANGSGSTATRTVRVDGTSVGTVSLPALANWDTWGTATLTASLTAGRRTVRLAYESANAGAINLDSMVVARP